MTREVAELFLAAFDNDSIGTWCDALRAWEEIGAPDREGDDLGRAVKRLRQAWWHDGSPEKRGAVKDAAKQLRKQLRALGARQ
jgi:hypothetical protein